MDTSLSFQRIEWHLLSKESISPSSSELFFFRPNPLRVCATLEIQCFVSCVVLPSQCQVRSIVSKLSSISNSHEVQVVFVKCGVHIFTGSFGSSGSSVHLRTRNNLSGVLNDQIFKKALFRFRTTNLYLLSVFWLIINFPGKKIAAPQSQQDKVQRIPFTSQQIH